MSETGTKTASYTEADIIKAATCVKTDLIMIADSTRAWTPQQALDRAHDIEMLAKAKYLKRADVMLFSHDEEVRAVRFIADIATGGLTSSRPGGVRWDPVPGAALRVVLTYADSYTDAAAAAMKSKLKLSWSATSLSTSHAGLRAVGGREYLSNEYGIQRKDWAA